MTRRDEGPVQEESTLKRALLAIEFLEAQVREHARRASEPIAVIGIGCRFPGGIDSFESFRRVLWQGESVLRPLPVERFGSHPLIAPEDLAREGAFGVKRGGFLSTSEVEGFDPTFFRITPREAGWIDPQQRLVLRVAWEALEHAGIDPFGLKGSGAEVYVGTHGKDYSLLGQDLSEKVSVHYSPGVDSSYLAARLSHFLDLRGPSLVVDTACSSSLVAVHLACRSLRTGSAPLAIAGGVKLILSPELGLFLHKTGAMSPTGRCLPFDQAADGMVQAEGCGLVVLKRLRDAERDGDRILAVLRGTAVNHDGAGAGLTVPNPAAQAAVIDEALRDGAVDPLAVDYVEAHGTGTTVGDPIELRALSRSYCRDREPGSPLLIGTAKSVFGHAESAAGIAGLIKAIAVLRTGTVPPAPYFQQPNQEFGWDDVPMRVPAQGAALPQRDAPRLAGVSSFGMCGVNAHAVVAEYPAAALPSRTTSEHPCFVLPMSCATRPALQDMAERMRTWVMGEGANFAIEDVVYTMARRRARHRSRCAIAFRTREELVEGLTRFREGGSSPFLAIGDVAAGTPRVVFVFSGQGSQWTGMGRELFESEPVFAAKLRELDELLRAYVSWSLLDVMYDDAPAAFEDTQKAQPVLFAFQVALAELYRSHGIEPEAVVGHSVGEIAAAHVAGVLDLRSALSLVVTRGKLMSEARGRGYMAAVQAGPEQIADELAEHVGQLAVAAVNAPGSCVLSGATAALDDVRARLHARGIGSERLDVEYAFHSPQMEEAARQMAGIAEHLPQATPRCVILSSVYGRELEPADLQEGLRGRYWHANLRDQVRFADAIDAALTSGYRHFLELAPRAVLSPDIRNLLAHKKLAGTVIGAQRKALPQRLAFCHSLGELFCAGISVDFAPLAPSGQLAELPSYPWQLERFWLPASGSRAVHRGPSAGARVGHPWFGKEIRPSFNPHVTLWDTNLAANQGELLSDHRVGSQAVVPAVLMLEGAVHAGLQRFGALPLVLEDVRLSKMVVVENEVALQVTADGERDDVVRCSFTCREGKEGQHDPSAPWESSAYAEVRRDDGPAIDRVDARARARAMESGELCDHARFYGQLERRGMGYGPTFALVHTLWRAPDSALARLELSEEARRASYGCHLPLALFDAALHASLALAPGFMDASSTELHVPVALKRVRTFGLAEGSGPFWTEVRSSRPITPQTLSVDVTLSDDAGAVLAVFEGVTLRRISAKTNHRLLQKLLSFSWEPTPLPEKRTAGPARSWLLICEDEGDGTALASALRAAGEPVAVATTSTPDVKEVIARAFTDGARDPQVLFVAGKGRGGLDENESARALQACLSLTQLVQAIEQRPWSRKPRLWLVTQGAHAAPGAGPNPWQAPVNGLGRVVSVERGDLGCIRVDVADGVDDPALLAELLNNDGEDELAYRGGVRFVGRLRRVAFTKPTDGGAGITFDPHGSYFVTGGTGGIGLEVAQWLVQERAGRVVLAARSELSTEVRARLAALDPSGERIVAVRCDVSRESDVVEALETISRTPFPLRGVFHAAGVLDDVAIDRLDRARLERVLAPKMQGAFYLHKHTANLPLDHFVLFSSVSSLIGSPGQANYVAGNAYLDALAHARRALGKPALSINWGAWAGIGMVATGGDRRLEARGLRTFEPEQAIEALASLMQTVEPQHGVALFDPERWREHYPHAGNSSLLRQLVRKQGGRTVSAPIQDIRRTLLEIEPSEERASRLTGHMLQQVREVTGLTPEQVPLQQPFAAFGFDSLMAMELRNRLNTQFEMQLTIAQIVSGSIATISSLILNELATVHVLRRDAAKDAMISDAARPPESEEEMEELCL